MLNTTTHWTYASQENSSLNLLQGDVLEPTERLLNMLSPDVHPYFANREKYPRFMVLTQSCDLVRRTQNMTAKSPYITLCAVRYAREAISKKIEEDRTDQIENNYNLCHTKHKDKTTEFVKKLLNNNASGYFYLHETGDDRIPESMCAVLPVSIALKIQHYDICLEVRKLSLDPLFRSKLGWLVGDVYSRIATRDWVNDPTNENEKSEFEELVSRMVRGERLWVDGQQMPRLKQVITSGEVDGNDPAALTKYLQDNPPPKKPPSMKQNVLALIEACLRDLTNLEQNEIEVVKEKLSTNSDFARYLK